MSTTRDFSQFTKKDIKDPISFEVFAIPLITSCGHLFEETEIRAYVLSAKDDQAPTCPTCQQEILTLESPPQAFLDRFEALLKEYPALQNKRYLGNPRAEMKLLEVALRVSSEPRPNFLENMVSSLLSSGQAPNLFNQLSKDSATMGISPVFYLAATSAGRQLLRQHEDLRKLITADTLNTVVTASNHEYESQSAAFWLLSTSDGQEILHADAELRNKILEQDKYRLEQMMTYLIDTRMENITKNKFAPINLSINKITAFLANFIYSDMVDETLLQSALIELSNIVAFGQEGPADGLFRRNPFIRMANGAFNDLQQIVIRLFPAVTNAVAEVAAGPDV